MNGLCNLFIVCLYFSVEHELIQICVFLFHFPDLQRKKKINIEHYIYSCNKCCSEVWKYKMCSKVGTWNPL